MTHRDCRGFTLIELLVVIMIIAVLSGLGFSLARQDKREGAVKAAADELAATMRDTRERAIRTRSCMAISFNLANAPGSSGRVLNNRSGGHWYRVMGPYPGAAAHQLSQNLPPIYDRYLVWRTGTQEDPTSTRDIPLVPFLRLVERSWVGERHQLPAKQVRFLALTDQDNGDMRWDGDAFAPTYPRPWFGYRETRPSGAGGITQNRLYAWGGYDFEVKMRASGGSTGTAPYQAKSLGGYALSPSGFYYEGYDGRIIDCVHPSDRLVKTDTTGNDHIQTGSDDLTKDVALWKKGESRALIDASWGDYLIVFRPDGTVTTLWMRMRHELAITNPAYLFSLPGATTGDAGAGVGQYTTMQLGPGDRCNLTSKRTVSQFRAETFGEATSLVERSGFWYITLAPDALNDVDTFASADEALRSISPLYRVGVSPFGEVRVVRVRLSARAGQVLDTTISGAAWEGDTGLSASGGRYQRMQRTTTAGVPESTPISDTVTPDMMNLRTWWWQ